MGLGALCGSCGDRRLEHLRHFELHTTWLVLCHNCAARADRLNPLPRTPLALIERIARDRRQREEMRVATHSPLAPAPSARPGRSSVAGDGLERRVAVRSQRSLGGAAHLAVDDLPEEATSEFGMITAVHLKV